MSTPGRGPTFAPTHWPALDGLRGLAVAGVVAYHLDWLGGGFLGVDLFFALSGFLITTLLVREARETGGIGLLGFWARRFRRLLPAVALMMAVVLGWLAIWGTPAEQATGRTDGRWSLPYLANWHFIASSRDYWAAATTPSVFTHLWSLAIEEQFYVLWPLVVWLVVRRFGPRALTVVAGVGAAASAAAMIVLYDPDSPSRVYFGTDTRVVALLLGAVFAVDPLRLATERFVRRRPRATSVVVGCGLAGLIAWWVTGGWHLQVLLQGVLSLHSLLSAVVVALLATSTGRWARLLAWRPLEWLGQRSYGIYLWHYPILRLALPRLDDAPSLLVELGVIVASLLVAEASFRLVEQPIRRQRGWAGGHRAGLATAAIVALAAVTVVAAPSGRGHVAAFDPSAIGDTVAPATTAAPATSTSGPPAPTVPGDSVATTSSPTTTTPPTTTTLPRVPIGSMVWLGDSVAADLGPALIAAVGSAGVDTSAAAFDGGRLVSSEGVDAAEVYPRLLGEHPADLVVFQLSFWDSSFDVDVQRAAITWFTDLVLSRGAVAAFVTPPPVIERLQDPGLERQIAIVRELETLHPGQVQLVDSTAMWGTEYDADMDDDGAPDRKPDGVHVCPQGAARFAAWFVDQLAARYDGLSPVHPSAWVDGEWATSERYDKPVGACALLTGG